jgi:hypothetical protein
MTKSSEKKLLLFKIETTEGVDSAPVVGTNAILTRKLDASQLEGDEGVRELDGQYFGARPSYYKQIRKPFSFEVEIAGSGVSATTVPAWMPLNRVCGFDAGVAGGASVVQTPISAGVPSATAWPFYDNLKVAALGARGSFTMTFEDDEIPFFAYSMVGFPPAGIVSEVVPGAPTLTGFAEPLLVNTANTTFSLDAYSPPLRRLVITLGAKTEPRSLTGPADRVAFRNREVTAEALVEFPDIGTKNYYTKMLSRTTQALQLVHGTVAGNIVQVDAARALIGLISTPEEQGFLMATIPMRFLPSSAGNDDFTITSK